MLAGFRLLADLRVALLLLLPLVRADEGDNCTLTQRPPGKARYLKFCQDYNREACCIPGHDLENQVQFENLIDGLGPGCKNPMMYPEVRFFYCLGCDPQQPKYANQVSMEISVCKSFLDKLWRDPSFHDCGVMYSNPCPSSWNANPNNEANWNEEDFDPYQCGDTLVLPRQEYHNDVVAFINVFKPPGLEDYTFVSVDDSVTPHADCWIAKTYTNSGAPRLTSTVTFLAVAVGLVLQQLL